MDPLLKDACEKKLKFRRHISYLMQELNDTKIRLALQDERFVLETQSREEAERKAKRLEEEVGALHALLHEKDRQLQAVTSSNAQNLTELDMLREKFTSTQETAEASSTVEPTNIKCFGKDLFELLLEKIENIHYNFAAKEREVAKLMKNFRMLSAYWKFKIKDLEAKLEMNRSLDEELKIKVLKLEDSLQRSQSQLLILRKIEAKRDETIEQLARSITRKHCSKNSIFKYVNGFWDASCTKFAFSVSVTMILYFVLRRK
ncbi:hypothetical protein LUZ61_001846 [Rhynchospora tenuis]|uniref:Uncharacterized protein n=1 Tax=Rhynchospora tenuis TaxID=198213 RepID=A0AAD6ER92_9POAL|nr:hypothetical protein LUZ61_001846 [Rhynchospora tenuis]